MFFRATPGTYFQMNLSQSAILRPESGDEEETKVNENSLDSLDIKERPQTASLNQN
jgi:hypothetical protein